MSPLPAQPISPLDGRYRGAVGELGEHLSEAGLNRARVRVEVEWLIYLTDHELFGSHRLDAEQVRRLRELVSGFVSSSAASASPRSMSSRVSRRRPGTRR